MQLSSCIEGMKGLLEQGMDGFNTWKKGNEEISELEWYLMDTDERAAWKKNRIKLSHQGIRETEGVLDKFNDTWKGKKWNTLINLIESLSNSNECRKIIIFTRWIPSMDFFIDRKDDLGDVSAFYATGSMRNDQREEEMDRFQQYDGFAVLFANDVVSEGIDLHDADCIINYDLTLNPQRIEQRIGRIDRIGQKSNRIFIYNLIVKGSKDESIFNRILDPIEAFEQSLGPIADIIVNRYIANDDIDRVDSIALRNEVERIRQLEDLYDDSILISELDIIKKDKDNIDGTIDGWSNHLILEAFLDIISEGEMRLVHDENNLYQIKGMNDAYRNIITNLIPDDGMELSHIIDEELSMCKTVSFRAHEGLPLFSIQHPIMQIAINTLTSNPWYFGIDTIPIVINAKSRNMKITDRTDRYDIIMITEYSCPINYIKDRQRKLWIIKGLDGSTDNYPMDSIEGILNDMSILSFPYELDMNAIDKLNDSLKHIEDDFRFWLREITSRDCTLEIISVKSRIRRLHAQRYHLLRRVESEDKQNKNIGSSNSILNSIQFVEHSITESESYLMEIETTHRNIHNSATIFRDGHCPLIIRVEGGIG